MKDIKKHGNSGNSYAKSTNPKRVNLNIRATESEIELWRKQADKEGYSLSELVRTVLNERSKQ